MPNELTNPNNVVTEERLAQFYQQILPYLGGMPDVMMSKFSKSDIYSPEEQMVGVWTDGKPLYQKVVSKSISVSANQTTNVENLSSLNIGTVCKMESTFFASGEGTYLVPEKSNRIILDTNSVLKFNANTAWSGTITVILQYTKTTDSPVEIGDDTDYSTTEKIVGTWIDGKPIWQKTISCGTVTADGSWHEVQHSISGIDQVVRADGALFGNNGIAVPVCSVVSSFNFTAYTEADKTKVNYVVGSSRSSGNYKLYVTIQYTKTS